MRRGPEEYRRRAQRRAVTGLVLAILSVAVIFASDAAACEAEPTQSGAYEARFEVPCDPARFDPTLVITKRGSAEPSEIAGEIWLERKIRRKWRRFVGPRTRVVATVFSKDDSVSLRLTLTESPRTIARLAEKYPLRIRALARGYDVTGTEEFKQKFTEVLSE